MKTFFAVAILLCIPALGSAQVFFEDCGTLIQGVECVLFQSDNFGLYVLDNLDGFGVGDRVRVVGILDTSCVTTCLQGDGCIFDNTITVCDATAIELSTWARIKALYGVE